MHLLSDRDSEISLQRSALARLRAVELKQPEVSNAAKDFDRERAEFLAGKSENIAHAELQTRLKALIESAGARLRTVRPLPADSSGATFLIGSRFNFDGPLQAVHRAIYAIETATPYLLVKSAVIKPTVPAVQTTRAQEPTLDVQLDVLVALRARVSG